MKTLFAILLTMALPAVVAAETSAKIHKAAFEETFERYPSPYAVIQQFKHIAPYNTNMYQSCFGIDQRSAPVIGTIDPLQESALEETPGALFYPYYESCIRDLITYGFANNSEAEAETNGALLLGEELIGEVKSFISTDCQKPQGRASSLCWYKDDSRMRALWLYMSAKDLPQALRQKMMLGFVRYLTGPDAVLRRMKLIGAETVFGKALPGAADLADFLETELMKVERDSNFSMLKLYGETAILLRLGPALKH